MLGTYEDHISNTGNYISIRDILRILGTHTYISILIKLFSKAKPECRLNNGNKERTENTQD